MTQHQIERDHGAPRLPALRAICAALAPRTPPKPAR